MPNTLKNTARDENQLEVYGRQSSVVRLQQQLARAGYYRGSIDGIMGSRTRYALRAYQHDHGAGNYGMTDR